MDRFRSLTSYQVYNNCLLNWLSLLNVLSLLGYGPGLVLVPLLAFSLQNWINLLVLAFSLQNLINLLNCPCGWIMGPYLIYGTYILNPAYRKLYCSAVHALRIQHQPETISEMMLRNIIKYKRYFTQSLWTVVGPSIIYLKS
jgi:hypothetical protein